MKFVRKTCEEEYEKHPKLRKEDVLQVMDWVQKQPYMPLIEEFTIIQYYLVSDYSQQKTKDLLDLHYTFRNEALEFFPDEAYEPPKYPYNVWDVYYIIELPKTTPEGYKLVYCGLRDHTPSKYHFEVALHTFIRTMITVLGEQGSFPGYVCIFDIEGIVVSHLATVTVSLVRKFLYFIQEAIPVRVKGVHVINVSSIIDKLMMLAKPFLKKELFEMIHIQADMNNFYKMVPKDCIPNDIPGGAYPSTRKELQVITTAKYDTFYDELTLELRKRTDERKRTNPKRNEVSMEGSFKKLSID